MPRDSRNPVARGRTQSVSELSLLVQHGMFALDLCYCGGGNGRVTGPQRGDYDAL